MLRQKKNTFLDEESIDNLADNLDDVDDEDCTPQSETRVTRSSLKSSEQKPKATYKAEAKYKDSDVSIDSSGSIYKPTKKGFSRKILEVKSREKGSHHQCIQVILFQKQHSRWDRKKWLLHQQTPLLTRISL